MKKPNILFLLTDDQRFNTIHELGNEEILTPNLDELVKDSISMMNAYIPGGYTGAVCMPSRCMINTGRYLTSLVNNGEEVPTSHHLLGEMLKDNGYYTFGTGKWHNGPKAYTRSFTTGANAFFGGMWDHYNVPLCDYDPLGNYDNVINFVCNFFESNKSIQINCDHFIPGKHSSEIVADTTIEFINNYDNEEPFYCYSAFLAPHDPRIMPSFYKELYKDKKITLPINCMEKYPVAYDGTGMRDEDLTSYPRKEEDTIKELTDYYAMITHLDAQIGRIIQILKEKGLYENTIIILAGDNGLGLGSHAFMGKQNLYEMSLRIPLIMKVPGLGKNLRVTQPVFLMDIYPTLCELIQAEIPESVEGKSFISALEEKPFEGRTEMYYMMMDRARAVRSGDWKLAIYKDPKTGLKSTVLYNIKEDPYELKELSLEYPEIVAKLTRRLFELRIENNDSGRLMADRFWN